MDDLFNVAIIVLVVLAQLGGAVIAAWKKRQAERERQERRGGMVVVEESSSGRNTPRRETSSWDSDEDDEPTERSPSEARGSYDDLEIPEESWEHDPDETEEPRYPAAREPVASPYTASQAVQRQASPEPPVPTQAHRHSPPVQIAGRPKGISRARRLLGRETLPQAILAQTILTPPPASRSLRR